MCKISLNHFTCGCSFPNPTTLTLCEWAKLKRHVCPSFQVSEDETQSKRFDMMACLEHS